MRAPRLVLAGALLAVPALTSAMTVEEFLTKTDAIKAKGVLAAMASPDVAAIRAETQSIKTAYRADVDAARAKGRVNMGCPPPAGQTIGGAEVEAALRAMPAAKRKRTSLKAGIYEVLRNRYRCK